MKVDFINPFLESMTNVLATMAMLEAKAGKPLLKDDETARGDITGLIGMTSPQAKGSLAITFSSQVLVEIAKRMLGEQLDALDESATDLAGEITNMVSGGAKRLLGEKGYEFDMAIPAVVSGRDHRVRHKTSGPKVLIPFETGHGPFFIEVCFEN